MNGLADSMLNDSTGVDWQLMYDRGPCYGFCPIYTFYLLDDCRAIVESKGHFLDTGWYETTLEKSKVKEILNTLNKESFWHPEFSDVPAISDLPSHHLIYLHENGKRELKIHTHITEALTEFFQSFTGMVESAKWETTSLRPKYFEASRNIIVQLKPGVEISNWVRRYNYAGVYVVKRIAPNQSYYLVSKDSNVYSFEDFFQALKTDEELIGAEWDKTLDKRD